MSKIPPRTPPIEEQDYLSGVKVVQIEDLRIARGLTRRVHSACAHKSLVYDSRERRVWCKDCETDVDLFDAFVALVERYSNSISDIRQRLERVKQAEEFSIRSLAAREIDKAWRSKTMVPCCPHCSNGLFPEDFKNGSTTVSREYALGRLGRKK